MKLRVIQFCMEIGELESTPDRGIVFRYSPEYYQNPGAFPISQSLPITGKEYSQAACLPFFSGLLPDGELRRRIAEELHISETSSLKLLHALGGECAGTLSLIPDEDVFSNAQNEEEYDEIPLNDLERKIIESERFPLMLPRGKTRLSLAGAQDKIPLLHKDGRWYKPKASAPTSHILKPASSGFPDIVHNEYAMMRLAAFLSLPVPEVELVFMGKPVLIVSRYDRYYDDNGILTRLHQEDCCQALGIIPERKYQADGGPGFTDLTRLIRRACSIPLSDLEKLIDVALFNVAVGNCDAHGKNFSLLYRNSKLSLAPFYDLLSTIYWPQLGTKLSMKFGNTYKLHTVDHESLALFAKDLGVSEKVIYKRLHRLHEAAPSAWERLFHLNELNEQLPMLESIHAHWNGQMRSMVGA